MAVATVVSNPCTQVTNTCCTGNGTITNVGVDNATRIGVAYKSGAVADPVIADAEMHTDGNFGVGDFFQLLSGLTANTDYNVRPYATNADGIAYGVTQRIHTVVGPDKVGYVPVVIQSPITNQ
jgi:hypothetical protein